MASIQRVFFNQLIIWILTLVLGTFACVTGFTTYITQKQLQTQHSVYTYLESSFAKEGTALLQKPVAQSFSDNLATLFSLKNVTFASKEQGELAKASRDETVSGLASLFISKHDPRSTQFATLENEELTVSFTITLDNEAKTLSIAIWVVLALASFACFLPWFPIARFRHRFSDEVCHTVQQVIEAHINNTPDITKSDTSVLADNLKDSLQRLKDHFSDKQNELELSAQSIKKEAYKDVVTELGNRNMFVEFYERNIENTEHRTLGVLALIRATELQHINQSQGYQQGDEYVKAVAKIITKGSDHYHDSHVFRLNSSDFVAILPNLSLKDSEAFAKAITSDFNQYQSSAELHSVACTGLVSYESGKPLGELLSNVDVAMSMAQSQQTNAWHVQHESELDANANMGAQNWRKIIESVLEDKQIELLSQTIKPLGGVTKAYSEIMVRFGANGGALLPTASLMAMADKLGKTIELDKLIIETALKAISKQNMMDKYFGLNVNATSAHDSQFVIWLERQLMRDSNLASRLVFEITESGLQKDVKASKRFIDMLHRVGARITVEHFGLGFTSFKFFREMKPDFIKMDTSYTRGLEEDKNNQYFLRLMVDLAHRIGVKVFAEGVESQEEKYIIEQLCLDGAQGYYIATPQTL